MDPNIVRKGEVFRDLHLQDGIFVMPNAWNAGSAYLLAAAGFAAIGTTSAGIAYGLAIPDYEGRLSRDASMQETSRITAAVDVPISVDAENGYGHEPEVVAETIHAVVEAGAVGASIEDHPGNLEIPLYDRTQAVERIRAARSAADSIGIPFTLTARAECYFVDHPEPFADSVERVNLYREAGADCLYVPGVSDAKTIAALVREVDAPANVVMGLVGAPLTVTQLEDLGVKRISIGGSLARATFALIRRAAEEIRDNGTFTFSNQQIPDDELCRLFSDRM
ncbi:MAG: isocitrate lyase/phosphoenolpyruvate mutase family protein [Gammaproteobacteria bacterium]|nr:isocitrate lyase/phosphoenolpyruvate mutase family protein [Gammaproteobacteria bacterium]